MALIIGRRTSDVNIPRGTGLPLSQPRCGPARSTRRDRPGEALEDRRDGFRVERVGRRTELADAVGHRLDERDIRAEGARATRRGAPTRRSCPSRHRVRHDSRETQLPGKMTRGEVRRGSVLRHVLERRLFLAANRLGKATPRMEATPGGSVPRIRNVALHERLLLNRGRVDRRDRRAQMRCIY